MNAAESALSVPAARAAFRFGARVLAVDSRDDATSCLLDAAYAPMRFLGGGALDHTALLQRYADGRLQLRFDRRDSRFLGSDSREPMLGSFYAARELFARFAGSTPGAIALYGALVAIEGQGVLLLGPTTIGKTLLALHLAHQGATFLGDDTTLLDLRTAEIRALPRRPSLRETALPFLPDSIRGAVQNARHFVNTQRGRLYYALESHDLGGITPREYTFPLRSICILRGRAEEFSARRLDMGLAVVAVAQRAYSRPSELAELAALRRALRNVACYDVSLGTPQESAAALLRGAPACA